MNKLAYLSGYMSKEARNVLLIHGFGGNSDIFENLVSRLEAAGHSTKALNYPSKEMGATSLVDKYITPFLKKNKDADIVAHSAGGLLTRMVGEKNPELLKNRRILMAAPATGGTPLANVQRLLNKIPFIKEKKEAPILSDLVLGGHKGKPINKADVGLMVGSYGDTKAESTMGKIKRALMNLRGKNDGVLALRDIKLPEARVKKELPLGHADLVRSKTGVDNIVNFLTKGGFK